LPSFEGEEEAEGEDECCTQSEGVSILFRLSSVDEETGGGMISGLKLLVPSSRDDPVVAV